MQSHAPQAEPARAGFAHPQDAFHLHEAQRLSLTGSFGWALADDTLTGSDAAYDVMGADRAAPPTLAALLQRVHPEDREFVQQTLARASAGLAPLDFVHRLLLADGTVRHVHVRATAHGAPGAVEYIGAVTDVSALKRSEALLAGEKQLLEMVARSAPLAQVLQTLCHLVEQHAAGSLCSIVLVDGSGQRLEHGAAPSLPDSFNAGIHGRPIHVDSGPCAMAASLQQQVIAADTAVETRWQAHDWCGHALAHGLRACWSTPIISSEGRPLGAFALYFRQPKEPGAEHRALIDQLTHLAGIAIERARAAEALQRSERQRRQTQRLEAMGTLAGGIAHDFNNILAAILGYGERALKDAPPGSRLRRDLDNIVAAGERGRALVDSILTFSRSAAGEQLAVHVEGVVREGLELVTGRLPPGITVVTRLQAGRAAMRGDPTQVHQILMNLATNAIQAMPAGGTLRVTLQAEHVEAPRPATIAALGSGDYILLEVADTGIGMAPELLERIFDPFFTTKDVGVGTGLGLSLVHGIVMEVGGAIELTSEAGAGSCFKVYLPRSGDAPAAAGGTAPAPPQGCGQRVLVVDDEAALVRLAIETLAELGYAPAGFTSGAAALEAMRADPEGFDAVLTDERMPGLSGTTLIRSVRDLRASVPILLLSGYVGGTVAGRAQQAGANEVLKKPLSAHELAAALARVLPR